MTSVLLIYPFFLGRRDRSRFRFPPLGVSYLAASLQHAGHHVHLLDCTFRRKNDALAEALHVGADIVGLYCMVTMLDDCLWFARNLRGHCRLLIAGGPLPTCEPSTFVKDFDVVVRGEAEQTLQEIVHAWEARSGFAWVAGIVYREANSAEVPDGRVIATTARPFVRDLDAIPFPARELLPNDRYIAYGKDRYGFSITTVMSSRGCPFRCDFCSNVVFGASYRERSALNVVDEIEQALALGYDRISFADDVFTLNRRRAIAVCKEIRRRGLRFEWECLGRVDTMDDALATEMRSAGCTRVFFGIESGSDRILELMNKRITTKQARAAVEVAHRAKLEVGAFFILGYPGETNETILDTLRFATSLPLAYLGLTLPYPLPGTSLYERTKDRITRSWEPDHGGLLGHMLTYAGEFSEAKMRFGLLKGRVQFEMQRRLGRMAPLAVALFEKPSDWVFRMLR